MKKVKLTIIILVLISVLNFLVCTIEKKKDVPLNLENCVIITSPNHIYNFPFVFGERLYMKDVESGAKKLLDNSCLPFGEINLLYSVSDNGIMYEIGDEDIYLKTMYLDFQTLQKREINIDMAIDHEYLDDDIDDKIYFVQACSDDSEENISGRNLYYYDLKNDKTEKIFDGKLQNYHIEDGWWSYFDDNMKSIIIRSVRDSEYELSIPTDNARYSVFFDDENAYVVRNHLLEIWDLDSKKEQHYKIDTKKKCSYYDAIKVMGNHIYYNVNESMYYYDYLTNENDCLIEQKPYYADVHFYDSAIVYDFSEVYDYNGRQLH